MRVFIDATVPIHAAGDDHPRKAPSVAFLEAVARGEVEGVTSSRTLSELLGRCGASGHREDGLQAFDAFSLIVDEVLPIAVEDLRRSRLLLEKNPDLPARAAIDLAVMEHHGIRDIVSYDHSFGSVRGVRRHEPEEFTAR
ncbi:MAG: type II toxin-antitoxin system VapC family toxin [Candidatus Eisenbacteria bacterium]